MQDYERNLAAWLKAAGCDVSVRFIGSHYQITLWDAPSARPVYIPGGQVIAKLDELTMPCVNCPADTIVLDGVNGTISAAPWAPDDRKACCYACDNAAMMAGEQEQATASIHAALRAGRGDCI